MCFFAQTRVHAQRLAAQFIYSIIIRSPAARRAWLGIIPIIAVTVLPYHDDRGNQHAFELNTTSAEHTLAQGLRNEIYFSFPLTEAQKESAAYTIKWNCNCAIYYEV